MVALVGMFAVLLKVLPHCPHFDLLRVVSMSNHDRRGLLFGRNLVNTPAYFDWNNLKFVVRSKNEHEHEKLSTISLSIVYH
jgi:hypothetical protein